jgi:hypothetical protein
MLLDMLFDFRLEFEKILTVDSIDSPRSADLLSLKHV